MAQTKMSATGLDVFDSTIHKTYEWLNQIEAELGLEERHAAYTALRATLHTLRDRLTPEEAVQRSPRSPAHPAGGVVLVGVVAT